MKRRKASKKSQKKLDPSWIYKPHFYVQVHHWIPPAYKGFIFGARGPTLKDAMRKANKRLREEWIRIWPKKVKRDR